IREMIKRMSTGTDREKRLAAATLIEEKTKQGSTKQAGVIDLGDGETLAYEPDMLIRWDGWLLEWKNLTLPWVEAWMHQSHEQQQEAQAELDRIKAENEEVKELFSGLPDRESLTIMQACNIKYRQGSKLARKWLLDLHRANARIGNALQSAAVAAHPDWEETKP